MLKCQEGWGLDVGGLRVCPQAKEETENAQFFICGAMFLLRFEGASIRGHRGAKWG